MSFSVSFAKIWFIISFTVLAFLYGTAVGKWEWFPHSFLNRAVDQARSTISVSYFQQQGPTTFTSSPKYDRKGVRIPRPEEVQPGLTLISSSWKGPEGWEPELRLIGRRGEVLHEWRLNREEVFQEAWKAEPSKAGVHGSYLLPDGDVVMNLDYVGMVRFDACGEVKWTVSEGNHHSISWAEDGSFWVPGVSYSRQTSTPAYPDGFPGLNKSIWMDRLLHISSNGGVLERINVLDVLRENGLERYIAKARGPKVGKIDNDPIHLNDIESLSASMADEYPLFEAGDLVVSLRYPSLVFVLDPETTEIKWYESRHFTRQHDPDFIGEGWIGVFDNQRDGTKRGTLLGGTRIVKIQPHTDSVTVPFPTPRSEPHYTPWQGKWQQLSNGNMIVVETAGGRVAEVNPSGHTVWEWIQTPINDSKVPSVTKATRHDLTRSDVASWPCSSVDSIGTSAQKQQTAQ